MGVESSHFKKQLSDQGAERASERRSEGHIGKVVNYHPNTGRKLPNGSYEPRECYCERHNGDLMQEAEMHSIDVDVLLGSKLQRLNSVPCFVYSQGVIDKGFERNDRVWIQYINGDPNLPVATAYYRDPKQLELFFNNLKYRVVGFMDELISG